MFPCTDPQLLMNFVNSLDPDPREGGGVLECNFGTGVRASILKPTAIIYLAFEKTAHYILDFTESRPFHIMSFE